MATCLASNSTCCRRRELYRRRFHATRRAAWRACSTLRDGRRRGPRRKREEARRLRARIGIDSAQVLFLGSGTTFLKRIAMKALRHCMTVCAALACLAALSQSAARAQIAVFGFESVPLATTTPLIGVTPDVGGPMTADFVSLGT